MTEPIQPGKLWQLGKAGLDRITPEFAKQILSTFQGATQHPSPAGVPLPLLLDMAVVRQGCGHRDLLRAGRHEPEVLAHGEQLAHQGGVTGNEGTAVAGQVAALAQRVDGEDALA